MQWATGNEKKKKLTPFMRHKRTQRTIAQTTGSQFPRVPIVKVNGLNSQTITELTQSFSGTPRSFKILLIKYPTSKSAIYKQTQITKKCKFYSQTQKKVATLTPYLKLRRETCPKIDGKSNWVWAKKLVKVSICMWI